MTSTSSRSASRCLRITPIASCRPFSVSSQVPVVGDVQQPVALHARDGLAHGRAALPEPLGDAGAQRDDALLLELVHRPQVHLGGVDEVAVMAHSVIRHVHERGAAKRRHERRSGSTTPAVAGRADPAGCQSSR